MNHWGIKVYIVLIVILVLFNSIALLWYYNPSTFGSFATLLSLLSLKKTSPQVLDISTYDPRHFDADEPYEYDWLPGLVQTGSGPFTLVATQEQNGITTATFARKKGSITTRFTLNNVFCDVAGAGANPRPSQLGNLGELTLGGLYYISLLFAKETPIISQLPLSPDRCTDVYAGLQPDQGFRDKFDAYLRTGTIPPEWVVTNGAVDLTKTTVLIQADMRTQ